MRGFITPPTTPFLHQFMRWQRKPVKSRFESHISKRNLGRVTLFVSVNVQSGYRYKSTPTIMLKGQGLNSTSQSSDQKPYILPIENQIFFRFWRDEQKARKMMRSYARNVSIVATDTTLWDDCDGSDKDVFLKYLKLHWVLLWREFLRA